MCGKEAKKAAKRDNVTLLPLPFPIPLERVKFVKHKNEITVLLVSNNS